MIWWCGMQRKIDQPYRNQRPGEFWLDLPASHNAFAFVQNRLEKQGKALGDTRELGRQRKVDDPAGVNKDVVIMHPDEREARQGRALGVFSNRPGEMPTLILCPQMEYAEKLAEQMDELRHYGGTRYSREDIPRRDVDTEHKEAIERQLRREKGLVTTGPLPKRRHFDH